MVSAKRLVVPLPAFECNIYRDHIRWIAEAAPLFSILNSIEAHRWPHHCPTESCITSGMDSLHGPNSCNTLAWFSPWQWRVLFGLLVAAKMDTERLFVWQEIQGTLWPVPSMYHQKDACWATAVDTRSWSEARGVTWHFKQGATLVQKRSKQRETN